MMRPLIPITLNISQKNKNVCAYEQFWIFSRYIDMDIDDEIFKEKLAMFKEKGLIIHQILLMGLMKLVEEHWQYHTLRMCEMLNFTWP